VTRTHLATIIRAFTTRAEHAHAVRNCQRLFGPSRKLRGARSLELVRQIFTLLVGARATAPLRFAAPPVTTAIVRVIFTTARIYRHIGLSLNVLSTIKSDARCAHSLLQCSNFSGRFNVPDWLLVQCHMGVFQLAVCDVPSGFGPLYSGVKTRPRSLQ